MSKIRSIEDYFVTKFNEAQDKIEELKAENDYLKEKLGQIPAQTDPTETVVLPVLEVRYRVNFSTSYIREEDFEAYKKAIADNDFEKIEKLYKQRYYADIISDIEINCIMEIGGTKFYCYAQLYNSTLFSYPDYIKMYKTEEEAQEAVIKQIKEYIEEKEKQK